MPLLLIKRGSINGCVSTVAAFETEQEFIWDGPTNIEDENL